jgi:heme-degrading monooxygenase HmoA
MYARKVSALLEPDSLPEFTNLVESEILPWLRRQEGFLDLVILAVPNSREVATISFWEHQENAQAYNATGYPEVLEKLAKLLDSVPYVKTFEVVASTFQNLALARSPETNNLPQEPGSAQSSYRSCQTSP